MASHNKENNIDDTYNNVEKLNKTIEGQILDNLMVTNICCRLPYAYSR